MVVIEAANEVLTLPDSLPSIEVVEGVVFDHLFSVRKGHQ